MQNVLRKNASCGFQPQRIGDWLLTSREVAIRIRRVGQSLPEVISTLIFPDLTAGKLNPRCSIADSWSVGSVAKWLRQRIANPSSSVRLRPEPFRKYLLVRYFRFLFLLSKFSMLPILTMGRLGRRQNRLIAQHQNFGIQLSRHVQTAIPISYPDVHSSLLVFQGKNESGMEPICNWSPIARSRQFS